MAYGTVAADVISTSVTNSSIGAGNASLMKNRIINGAMVISQRGTSFTNDTSGTQYCLDRWNIYGTQASKFSVTQSSTAPTGFINSLLVTSLSAYSILSTDNFVCVQSIEGLNCTDLAWGTVNAKTVTLSFQVYSSLTGTFGGSILNSAQNRSYPFSYSIPVANTWTTISITISGDTTGTWLTTNGVGIKVCFGLGVGSNGSGTAGAWAGSAYYSATGATSVVGTNGATFYITGIQLEIGSSATGFEYRQYQQELALCQRYYEKSYDQGTTPASSTLNGIQTFPVPNGSSNGTSNANFAAEKRTAPTIAVWDAIGNANAATAWNGSYTQTNNNAQAVPTANIGTRSFSLRNSNGVTGAYSVGFHWTASAEL